MSLSAFALAVVLVAQEPGPPGPLPPQADSSEALRVFLDCNSCDFDFLRTEITFVNYVRDRTVAQVHVLVTTQGSGSGTEHTLAFIGLGDWAGRGDTLRYASSQTDTADERRRGLARILKLGLVRYLAGTSLASRLDVRFEGGRPGAAQRRRDPWNFWVFEISASADFNGEESSSFRSIFSGIEARRVTEQWKLNIEIDASRRRNRFATSDTTEFVSRRSSWSVDGLLVRSVGPHWSLGGIVELEQNSFRNYDLQARVAPALEFSVFPYQESTRRQLTFQYAAGVEYANYTDTTIFGRLSEQHPLHYLQTSLEARQPWGNTFLSAEFLQYLHDAARINIQLNASASIRLVRGLRINFYGGYEVIRDQLYLSAAGATPEEIIAQQRALASGYSYYTGFGLSYTFGSIYNNIVNPRFD